MNYVILIIAFASLGLVSKLIAAFIISSKKVSNSKAKSIAKMFSFNPFDGLKALH